MSENPSAADWAGARGEKWLSHLSNLETMLRPVEEPLLGALQLDAPYRIADIGCGGGGTTVEVVRRAAAGSVVHGFDISPALVEHARQRAAPVERALAFDVADMAIASPDQPYDRLLSRFGVMFFDDPESAFANLARWLKPEGRFAFAVWGPPAENSWMTSVRAVVEQFVDLPRPGPDDPGPFRYADAAKLLALLGRTGFTDLEANAWRGVLPIGGATSASEAAGFAISSMSGFEALLSDAGGGKLEQARRALTASYSDHLQGGVVQMAASIHLVSGARR
jgi:SAM-dependent methyltransferase